MGVKLPGSWGWGKGPIRSLNIHNLNEVNWYVKRASAFWS